MSSTKTKVENEIQPFVNLHKRLQEVLFPQPLETGLMDKRTFEIYRRGTSPH